MTARRPLLLRLPLLLVAMAVPARSARAQEGKPGRVTSRAFHPIEPGAMIEVSPLDDRSENLRVAAAFRDALARAGHLLGDASAPLRLSFDTEIRPVSGPGRPQVGASAATGAAPGDQAASPLPDQPVRRGSDSMPRRPPPPLRYVINAVLDERAGGRRIWQGNVRYDDAEGDRARTLARLVAPLMPAFGKTERGRSFALE